MPTLFTHAAVGFITGKVAAESTTPNTRMLVASMALSAMPDIDALFIGVIPYNHPFGHRGFTHSIFFAAVIGLLIALLFSKADWAPQHSFWLLAVVFAVTTATHGFFDAMTDGGLGIAFFAPFSNARYFFPWRPIPVAPFSLANLMSEHGSRVIRWELAMFWTFALGAFVWNRKSVWRIGFAVLCAVVGAVMWILAINL